MKLNVARIGDQIELVLEKSFTHSATKVWQVLIDRELLRQWFPCDVTGQWSVGENLQFRFPDGQREGLPEQDLRGKVLVVDPPNQLEFTWGKYQYRCELTAAGGDCRLRFTENGSGPTEAARSAAGWEMCFENFDALLQGGKVALFTLEAWQPKFEKYVKKFEPELGIQEGAPS